MVQIILLYIHMMCAILWIGGMAFFFITLIPTLQSSLEPAERLKIMSGAGKRFKHISFMSIGLLVITGIAKVMYIAKHEEPSPNFWKVLGIKLILVTIAISLSVIHDFFWGPRLIAPRPTDDVEKLRRKVHILARFHFASLLIIAFLGVLLMELS